MFAFNCTIETIPLGVHFSQKRTRLYEIGFYRFNAELMFLVYMCFTFFFHYSILFAEHNYRHVFR